jgi:hypothetical protein
MRMVLPWFWAIGCSLFQGIAMSDESMLARIAKDFIAKIHCGKGVDTHNWRNVRSAAVVSALALLLLIVGVVEVPYAIADTATLVVPLNGRSTQPHYFPEIVIALVSAETLFSNHFEMFSRLTSEKIGKN